MTIERLNILVVDDESEIRELLVEYLTTLGHDVREATDGNSALAILYEESIDVMLTDVRMPVMEGVDLIERLKDLDVTIGVVVMTGYPTVQTFIDAMSKGANAYILKPFRLNAVHQALQEAARHSRLERHAARLEQTLNFYEAAQNYAELEEQSALFHHLAAAARAETRAAAFQVWLARNGDWVNPFESHDDPWADAVDRSGERDPMGRDDRLEAIDPDTIEAPRCEQGLAVIPVLSTDIERVAVFAVAGDGVGATHHLDRLRQLARALGLALSRDRTS